MPMQTRKQGDVLVVELEGRLDSYTAAEAADALIAVGKGPEMRVVLSLKRLDYINSSSLTAILVCARHLKARGGELVLAAAHGNPAMALETAGFDTLLRMLPTVEEAIAVLGGA